MLTRILTAIILLPCVIAAIWFLPPFYFSLLLSVFILLGAWEWAGFMPTLSPTLRFVYVMLMAAGIYVVRILPPFWIIWVGLAAWIWIFCATVAYQIEKKPFALQNSFLRVVFGFFVLLPCWVALDVIRNTAVGHQGSELVLLVLAIIWAADIGAYFTGRAWGKKHLIHRVSPKKTWAGLFGGLACALVVTFVGCWLLPMAFNEKITLMVIGLVTALLSVIGDLGISLLKRLSHVKDSGVLFPGHGGVLDRMDSVAAATVIFVLCLPLIGFQV